MTSEVFLLSRVTYLSAMVSFFLRPPFRVGGWFVLGFVVALERHWNLCEGRRIRRRIAWNSIRCNWLFSLSLSLSLSPSLHCRRSRSLLGSSFLFFLFFFDADFFEWRISCATAAPVARERTRKKKRINPP